MSENIIKGKEYYEIVDILNAVKIDKKTAKEIVENFIKNNLILTTHAYEYILKNKIYEEGGIENIIKIAKYNETNIVTKEFIIEFCIKKEEKASEEREKLKEKAGEEEENTGCIEEEKKEENKEGEEKTKEELKLKEQHKEVHKEEHKEESKEGT